jgi:hypothetical protein
MPREGADNLSAFLITRVCVQSTDAALASALDKQSLAALTITVSLHNSVAVIVSGDSDAWL